MRKERRVRKERKEEGKSSADCTCSLSTVALEPLPPLPTTGAKIVFVEGGVAATGELTISFNVDPPSTQELPGNALLLTAVVGGPWEDIDEGVEAVCWKRARERRALSLLEIILKK